MKGGYETKKTLTPNSLHVKTLTTPSPSPVKTLTQMTNLYLWHYLKKTTI